MMQSEWYTSERSIFLVMCSILCFPGCAQVLSLQRILSHFSFQYWCSIAHCSCIALLITMVITIVALHRVHIVMHQLGDGDHDNVSEV
jgi:hypothetical protein